MSEGQIIAGLKAGNESSFKTLVESYQQMIVNTCFSLVHNTEDAEDIAQDVFIEVFRSIEKFKGESKLSTWLYRIAINRSLNFIRDNKHIRALYPSEKNSANEYKITNKLSASVTDQTEFQLENSQRAQLLHEAIDSLPKNQRVAFTLNKYEDLSYKEISGIMNLTVSSVESLIHRAKLNLQKKLYKCYIKKCI